MGQCEDNDGLAATEALDPVINSSFGNDWPGIPRGVKTTTGLVHEMGLVYTVSYE
jgi:hypothetical protein